MTDIKPIRLTKNNFESDVLKAAGPVLVDFWADWCAPCHRIAPVLEELAGDFAGRATVAKLHVDDEPELAARYGVRSIPSLLFFRDGEVAERVTGVTPKKALAAKLQGLLAA